MALLLAGVAAACLIFTAAAPADNAAGDADMQWEFANRLLQLQSYSTAAPQFRKFLEEYPEDPRREEARYQLAMCYYVMGEDEPDNYERALAELVTLRMEFPNGKRLNDSLFRSGHIRYLTSDAEGAIDDLSTLLEQDGVAAELAVRAHHFLGRARYDLGQHRAAIEHLNRVAEAPEETPLRRYALIVLANAHTRKSQFEQAANTIDTLLADHPDLAEDEDLLIKLADARLAVEQYDRALATYQRIDDESPYRFRAALGIARSYLGLDRNAEAMQAARALLDAYEPTPETEGMNILEQCSYIIGVVHFKREEWAEAAAAFETMLDALKQGGMAEDAAYRLCWSYYHLGEERARNLVAASAAFRRMFPASDYIDEVVFLAGEGHRALGDFQQAISYYERIEEHDPNYHDALYRIAYSYHRAGRTERAARAYDAFVEAQKEHRRAQDALYEAAALYQGLERYELAAERYHRFIEKAPRGPEQAEAMYQQGVCYARMGRFDRMDEALTGYVERYPDGEHIGSVHYWLARHHRIQADTHSNDGEIDAAVAAYRRAEQSFQRALEHDPPEDKTIRRSIAELRYRLGETLNRGATEAAEAAEQADDADTRAALEEKRDRLAREAADTFGKSARDFLDLAREHPELIGSEDIYFWVGSWFRRHEEPESAIEAFLAFREHRPESENLDRALYQLIDLHGSLEPANHEAVIQYADELIEKRPQSELVLRGRFDKAEALFALRRYDEARPLYREVSREGGGVLRIASDLKLGHIHLAKEEYSEAVGQFARVGLLYQHDTFTPEALYFAGRARARAGGPRDIQEAVNFWQQLARNYPASQWTARMRDDLEPLGYHVAENGTIEKK